jgi:hypothetical protein
MVNEHNGNESINTDFGRVVQFIQEKEPEIIALFQSNDDGRSLAQLSSLSCADVTYLLAYWAKEQLASVEEVFEFTGKGKGLTMADGHTVLGIKIADGYVYVDGTIWQVDPTVKHIRISGPYPTTEEALAELAEYYGGTWERMEIPPSLLTPEWVEKHKQLIKYRVER